MRKQKMRCPDCGAIAFYHTGTEIFCKQCGLLIDDQQLVAAVDKFVQESAQDPRLAVASGLGVRGKIVKNSWLYTRREKNLVYANKFLDLLTDRLTLNKQILTDTIALFAQINNSGLLSGRTLDQFICASLYHTCMVHELPKTLVELSMYSGIPIRDISQGYKLMKKKIMLPVVSIATIDLIPKYGSDIGLSQKAVSRAMELCTSLDKKFTTLPPRTKAVVFLYTASKELGENKPQRIFTNATGVLERVIRLRQKQFNQFLSKSS